MHDTHTEEENQHMKEVDRVKERMLRVTQWVYMHIQYIIIINKGKHHNSVADMR